MNNFFFEASAGTGKTYTIVNHIVENICAGTPIDRILTVTFTEKAAQELATRIRETLEKKRSDVNDQITLERINFATAEYSSAYITTIHGFCLHILKRFSISTETSEDIRIADSAQQMWQTLVDILLAELPALAGEKFPFLARRLVELRKEKNEYFSVILRAAEFYKPGFNVLFPETHLPDVTAHPETVASAEIMAALTRFLSDLSTQSRLQKATLAFEDIILLVFGALKKSQKFCHEVAAKFDLLIVDEFQDTDPVQWGIFQMLIESNPKLAYAFVGDPKQAIYGFRGGDLASYQNAKTVLRKRKTSFMALKKNFRSTEKMIGAFNLLFQTEFYSGVSTRSWFTDLQDLTLEKGYKNKNSIVPIQEQLTPVVIVEARNKNLKGNVFFARYTLSEIQKIREQETQSTIAILVRQKSDAEPFETEFRSVGLEYVYYKKAGLYENNEALQLKLLLSGLLDSTHAGMRLAMLTEFTDHTAEEFLEETIQPAITEKYHRWKNLLLYHSLPEFFRIVLAESRIWERLQKHSDSKKRIANYQFLIHLLIDQQIANNLTVSDLLQMLVNKTFADNAEETNDLEPLQEISAPVQIMTIHQSKGLEFDYVFVSPATKDIKGRQVQIARYDEGKPPKTHKVQNLWAMFESKESDLSIEISEKVQKLAESELERLYYVALTRACTRLYLPLVEQGKNNFQSIVLNPLLLKMVKNGNTELFQYDNFDEIHLAQSKFFADKKLPIENYETQNDTLVARRFRTISSFTSLSKSRSSPENIADLHFEPESKSGEFPNTENYPFLPMGIQSGLLLHELLEELDFSRAALHTSPEALALDSYFVAIAEKNIARYLSGQLSWLTRKNTWVRVHQGIINDLADIVYHTLNTPVLEQNATLGNLMPTKIAKEQSFLGNSASRVVLSSEYGQAVQGSIDLVVEFENKFYVIDYKTNTLPPSQVTGAMIKEHAVQHYGLQMYLYAESVMNFLRNCEITAQESHFGGIIYLYLRYLSTVEGAAVQISFDEIKRLCEKV